MEFEIEKKLCLLSFAVFPENREVHRTMLMYWWIGEGFIPVEGAGESVREALQVFTDKKLVEPVQERRKVAPSSYKMNPFVHSSVIHLSQKIGLFDIYHEQKRPSMRQSGLGKVCLVEGSSAQLEAKAKKMQSPDQIETVLNVSERYPGFAFKWFSEFITKPLQKSVFKSLRVFYLGRWERTQKRIIEVPNPEIMKYLTFMTNLRLVSFQGISTIRKLNRSICKLHKLIVLDLRECSDLTQLPEKIESLHSLVYLDMTGCYMLEYIPMRLASLNNLEVLKGFVVSDTAYEGVACTMRLLKRLKKLRKLSIEIHRDDLGVHQLMEDLVMLKALTSLKVTWRKNLNTVRAGKPDDFKKIESLPDQLKKLSLQRFPHEQLPTWIHPHKLLHLKKLHIGGGRLLKGFGALPEKATECSVEALRLTSLPRLRIGWIEVKKLYFPNLTFLEKYDCPKISLTPCDGNGIWRSDQDDQ
ncbi:PREDICTED: disease resistance RPP13-like protein 4 [Camelina sativa]|uniref:Disease resistance RPP13-like protein 4 n=1 Tax=Camelina sativa TaxID=90675 RepID=A0ABM0U680_CAMSA|nr:PREDICTED: disease resistance RPP13-like protein 4 [Camelina sativa]